MFLLNGRPISPDVAFTDASGIQRPANWLRLASPDERRAVGITEVPDPPVYDQRFYWGPDLPKDHDQLVEQWTQQTRTTANTLLQPTDWIIIREADNGKPADASLKAWREAIRQATGAKITTIKQTATTAALATYVTSAEYSNWPGDPNTPIQPSVSIDAAFDSNQISTGF